MDFDFARFGFPNAGNTGKVTPKKVNTEKTKNVAAPGMENVELVQPKKADASALDATAAQNLGFVRTTGAQPISGSNAVDMAELYLRAGISNFRMPTEGEYARISASTIGAMNDIMTVGTTANAEKAIADFEKYFG
ncbi:hypothetical protein J6E39_00375 [bacterium]|nr:hypothetical protein [bacterium]